MNPYSAKCGVCTYRLLYVAISIVCNVYKANYSCLFPLSDHVGIIAFAITVVVLLVLCGAVSLVYWKRQTVSCRVVSSSMSMRIYVHVYVQLINQCRYTSVCTVCIVALSYLYVHWRMHLRFLPSPHTRYCFQHCQ